MEMVYFPNYLPEPVILYHEVYKGHEYYAVNMGPYPCCYAEVPVEHEFYRNRGISALSVPCHGGITSEEIVQECKEVIDYLAGMEQGCADVGAGTQQGLQNEKE